MNRLTIALLATAFIGSIEAKESGLGEKVRAALTDAAKGVCSAENLSPGLRATCDSQPQTAIQLRQLGTIEKIEEYGIQQFPNGARPMTFRITFEHGFMTWYAEAAPDGKLGILWSDGQIAPR